MQGGANVNFVRCQYHMFICACAILLYKLNKGYFLGFLFKPLGGLRPRRGLNKKASEKYPLSITYIKRIYVLYYDVVHTCNASILFAGQSNNN